MKWFFIDTGFNTGRNNMSFDMSLINNCKNDEAYFRLYRWKPFCISLGANQNFNSIDIKKASENNIDVVQRPTGGRAILHAEELTYSVVCPLEKISSLRKFYCEINKALREGLIFYDEKLSILELETEQPDLRSFYKQSSSEICFAVSAKSEIKFNGKKLVGSAQRKINKAVLQHGSILCGNFHTKIIEYLKTFQEDRSVINNDFSETTTDLEKILNNPVNYDRLKDSLINGFQKYFNIKFENVNLENFSLTEN